MRGLLGEIDVPNVIDLSLQMPTPTAIHFESTDHATGTVFVEAGQVVHALWGDFQGIEALERIFALDSGSFQLQPNAAAPHKTIRAPWNSVLLDILRRLDNLQSADSPSSPAPSQAEPTSPLTAALHDLLRASSFEGAAVVGREGLIHAAHLPASGFDEDLVGATTASIFALSARSTQQLKRGQLRHTLIQGKQGNIIVTVINRDALFVGLASQEINLGMAFAEARSISAKLAEQLGNH
jgi:predicted regulator of Ras-like GTPase activity (Roadblock/LC7/MglB family)